MFENVTNHVCFINCTRNGGWSDWTNHTCSPCNSTSGLMNQTRECKNPTPLGGGSRCIDEKGNPADTEIRYNVSCYTPCSGS